MSRSVTSRTRREWLQIMAAMGAGALVDGLIPRELARAATGRAAHQQDPLAARRAQIGAIPIQAQPLADHLTLLAGPGGNVVVLHGSEGLVVVDTFVSPAWPRFRDSLKGLGAPVKTVINTHWHFDHTDNNAALRAGGATVVAHENTKLRMTQPHHLAVLELDLPPSPAAALPQRVFKDGYKLEANGERLAVTHVPPAHTDTDVIVRFEQANVLHGGDTFFNGRYPYIDGSTGGRVDGMIAAADRLLSLADAGTKIVPGHGPLGTKADLAKYRDMLSTAADRVRKLKASGKSLDEAIATKPFTDLDADWGKGAFNGDTFVKVVYLTL
ncbi:MAG TPA: MBL fold metallo-hydrolase [Gemmatimonadales bacterium]|nr:MBL fold metallo-hydrolase [Gemmatimonadales bacterium]